MVSSICGVKRAFTLKSYGFERWYLMLISAVVTLVLAITIVIHPALYGDMLMMAIGIVMIVEAVSDLLGIHRLSKFIKDNAYHHFSPELTSLNWFQISYSFI